MKNRKKVLPVILYQHLILHLNFSQLVIASITNVKYTKL